MTVEMISWSISTKVWDRAGIDTRDPWIWNFVLEIGEKRKIFGIGNGAYYRPLVKAEGVEGPVIIPFSLMDFPRHVETTSMG